MDIGLIEGINSFASMASDPRLTILLSEICQRIEALELENKKLRARISEIEDYQDDHNKTLNNHAEAINKVWQISKAKAPKGSKTKERIEKLDQLLRSGARTLRQIEKELGISPQEMSRLISKLDKRKYQTFLRDGSAKEKVIKLRARI